MTTLDQILKDVNSYVDLENERPTGTELSVRVNYINQAIREWASSNVWQQLTRSFYPTTASVSAVALPSDFRELAGPPQEYLSSGSWRAHDAVRVQDRYSLSGSAYYCYIEGDPVSGQFLNFNNLSVGATVSVNYQRYPSIMATFSDICEVPDPQYVVAKTISYVLQSRDDARFPLKDAEAGRLLQNMVGRESRSLPGGQNTVRRVGSAAYSIGS
jgi:hypothetical protein